MWVLLTLYAADVYDSSEGVLHMHSRARHSATLEPVGCNSVQPDKMVLSQIDYLKLPRDTASACKPVLCSYITLLLRAGKLTPWQLCKLSVPRLGLAVVPCTLPLRQNTQLWHLPVADYTAFASCL